MDIPWELLGSGGVGAISTLLVLLPILKRNGGCPIPSHVTLLAKHEEAIETLKAGHATILNKLDALPSSIAAATAAATGVAIATALHSRRGDA